MAGGASFLFKHLQELEKVTPGSLVSSHPDKGECFSVACESNRLHRPPHRAVAAARGGAALRADVQNGPSATRLSQGCPSFSSMVICHPAPGGTWPRCYGIALKVTACGQTQVLTAHPSLRWLLFSQSERGNTEGNRAWTPGNPKVNNTETSFRLK